VFRIPTLLIFAASLACQPRVSSELALPADPVPNDQPEIARPQVDGEFDVVRALDGAEQILAVIDATAANPEPAPADGYEMESWLTDEGLRSLYYYGRSALSHGRSALSLAVLGELFGVPVHSSGPHGRDPDLLAEQFGHYDLRFVERVVEVATALGRDRARVERTRPAFERRLRRQALTYLLVYRAIHRDPEWFAQFERDYVAAIGAAYSTEIRSQDLEPMHAGFEGKGFSWYESNTAAYFWVRREQDGSATRWLRAIEALLAAYDVEIPAEPPGLPAGVR
jgi:hypothetical protein